MVSVLFKSPAKLNLSFHVCGTLPSGFHLISSLMQAVDLFDDLFIARKDGKEDELICSDPLLPLDHSNLVLKGALAFRRHYPVEGSFVFRLDKKIPCCAGLGGGSGNAATAIWGMNALLGYPYSNEELAQIGEEVGSDVPFFFSSGRGYCEGRGETVTSLPPVFASYVIIKPSFGLSTAEVYTHFDRGQFPLTHVGRSEPEGYNALEAAACDLSPQLAQFKKTLQHMGLSTCMTGSGSAFFSTDFLSQADQKILEAQGAICFSVQTITRRFDGWYEKPLSDAIRH